MTSDNIEKLREMQRRIEADAARTSTFEELRRLRAFWGDLQQIISSEESRLDITNGTTVES